MNLIFFGSDDFAAVNLEPLIASGRRIVACVTPPDKPRGRGLKLTPSPVKVCALDNDIPVLQPENVRDRRFIARLRAYAPDLFVVIAYGKILPQEILDIPTGYAVNVHASLLPKYRGAAPVNWAILNGDKETGISIIRLNAKMDAGDVIVQDKLSIEDDDTAVTLRAKLALLGADALSRAMESIEKGTARFRPQNAALATPAPKLARNLSRIVWNRPAVEIHNQARGLVPWPGAHTFYRGKRVKIIDTSVVPTNVSRYRPGEVIDVSASGFLVAAARNAVLVQKVNPESGKPMTAAGFAAGYKIAKGTLLDRGKE